MKKPELNFDTPPKMFPDAWEAGNEPAEVINALINKHVYLAIEDCCRSMFAVYGMTDGKADMWIGITEDRERKFSIEDVYLAMDGSEMERTHYKLFAASFQRIVDHMNSLARGDSE